MTNESRISTIRDRDGITITIKAERNWALLLILLVWFTVWTLGGIAAITSLLTGSNREPFVIIWLCGWLVGEILALVIWLWTAFGEEVVSIRGGSFIHSRQVFGRGITRTYPMHELFNLRASGSFGSDNYGSFSHYGLSGGTVAVDTRYGDTYRFGSKLEEREAMQLARDLEPYFRRDTQPALSPQ